MPAGGRGGGTLWASLFPTPPPRRQTLLQGETEPGEEGKGEGGEGVDRQAGMLQVSPGS